MMDAAGTAGRYPIRTATAETMESFAAPLNLAFAEMPDPGDEERRVWEPERISRRSTANSRSRRPVP